MIVYANYDYYKLKQLQEQTMGKTHAIRKETPQNTGDSPSTPVREDSEGSSLRV